MRTRPGILLFLLALAISCLPLTAARAQTQLAQWGPPPSPEEERERRHEEREREREREEWREHQEWQSHHQRYFGGTVIQPDPTESNEHYRNRVHAQCNIQWDQCARGCNTIRDAYRREACVANCNNELNECKAAF